jgi:hypothetical protein
MRAMRPLSAVSILLLVSMCAALGLSGCGPQCNVLQKDRDAFADRFTGGSASTRAPHLSVAMPQAALTDALDAAVSRLSGAPVDLPGLGDLTRYLPTKLELSPRKLQVALDKSDAARIAFDFDVKYEGRALFGLDLTAKAPIQFDQKSGKLRFSIRGDLFEKVKPRIDDGASRKLGDTLWAKVPQVARLVVQRSVVDRISGNTIDLLAENAYDLLRSQVLSKLGELTSFEIALPDVPIEALALSSVGSGAAAVLRLDVRTSLPVENGLGDASLSALASATSKSPRDAVRIQIAAETVTAMANWAMGKGKLPARYGTDGKAAASGSVEVGTSWSGADTRPMKVHLWSLGTPSMCVYGRAAGVPKVEYDGDTGKLKLGVSESEVEEVKGPPLLQVASFLPGVSQNIFDFSKTIATRTKIGIGPKDYRVTLKKAAFDGRVFTLDLTTAALSGKDGT